ncbi:ParA family protein [Paramagnetospirillum magneticum]|uniref:Chromosome partitioning protein ParA n=1 Tax=Paramagnetospirillum magneticum (strain ATCC 700264 / AMB-1) TaxID=342108 RepID=Q2W5W0_PARM1|nr:ParA family protein [Paramagnetospirillum magneticum]BAE50765.1 ATPase involved in chromosome partitioning [Paramagnetospirillum magneticum AMB-1]
MRPYIVAIFNQKGGISKTTTSTNLAVCLAAFGKSVVVIDLDSQGDSTKSLGIDPKTKQGIYDLFTNGAAVEDVMVDTMFEGVRVLPSTYSLAGIEIKLSEMQNSQRTLSNILSHTALDCDYVVIDCPPALGILPINALASAHGVIIPVTATPYANDGLLRTLPSIKYVQEGLNKNLLLQGVLFTINDKNKTTRKINELIRSRLGGTVYRTEIPRDTTVIEAATARLPVCVFAPKSPAAQAHLDFTEEFIGRHVAIAAKNNEAVTPHSPRDEAIGRLTRWRMGCAESAVATDDARLRQKTDQLDRMLYGDRTRMERWHLEVVHFFIENRLLLAAFLMVVLLGGLTLLGVGIEGARRLAGLLGFV